MIANKTMMTEAEKQHEAETFVRQVLVETFGRKLDSETLREIAKRVRRALPTSHRDFMIAP